MCGIFATIDYDELLPLSEINSYRGQFSHSVTGFHIIDKTPSLQFMVRSIGPFNITTIPKSFDFYVCHIQAPTNSQKSFFNIHPAELNQNFLWHNGIIKDDDCLRLNKKYISCESWDTKLLLKESLHTLDGLDSLSEVNGSFACLLWHNKSLYVFRNKISPLFYSNNYFSSVKKEMTDVSIEENKIFKIDFDNGIHLTKTFSFTTKENPYWGI